MRSSEKLLRYTLMFQGALYLAMNLWALLATRHFLSFTNPASNVFEARSFAALSLVLSLFFLAGTWRKDLLRPAAFVGLGSAVAITLVELFHLPSVGWTLLWFDMILQIVIAVAYVSLFFFRPEEEPEGTASTSVTQNEAASTEPNEIAKTKDEDRVE